ncbi:uncharacterized protein LOC123523332 [Mercenaria mercenaria]|uniref:uncharacterized protein LOC123523332 n=1 Tax=Mercenaria mercenaria TaxID=6596 RepID=UPI00234E6062|nr:uncharacterized protein LOC123523332 [Mercenaria mercenaria]
MTDLQRNTGSPVSVTVSRARSPAYGSCTKGKECLRAQARTRSTEQGYRRAVSPGNGLLGNDLSKTTNSSYRSRSFERRGSGRSGIPSITVTGVNPSSDFTGQQSYRNDNSETVFSIARSRSPSPFDWIEREKLPCGSPTFERVKNDMLSDSESSPRNSDTESIESQRTQTKKKTSKIKSNTYQKNSYQNKYRNKFKY